MKQSMSFFKQADFMRIFIEELGQKILGRQVIISQIYGLFNKSYLHQFAFKQLRHESND